jgi:hypothetical protein
MDGRIRDTAQDEGNKCARVFSKIFWQQPLLGLSFSGQGNFPLDSLTSKTSLSREGGSRS